MSVSNGVQSRDGREQVLPYIIEYFVHGIEAREEALLVGSGHFVGNAWVSVLSADDAVVGRVKAEFNNLIPLALTLL